MSGSDDSEFTPLIETPESDGLLPGGAFDSFVPFERAKIDGSIVECFEIQARRVPDRLALQCGRYRFTYAELNAAANRIAHALLDASGSGGEPVALVLKQGAMLFAAILGVLKAGKFYVPIDARQARARSAYVIRDTDPALLLCDHASRRSAEELAPAGAIVVDVEAIDSAAAPGDPGVQVAPETLAYVYHTSGSTGLPKGVADCHRNVLHNVMRYTNGLRISEEDRLSLVQSCTFSGCVSTQFGALLNGASLFPFDLHDEGPLRLARWVRQHRLTMFHGVPAIFRELADAAGEIPDLRVVRLEGDRATWSDVETFKAVCRPGALLVNGLGTTETGIVRRLFVDHQTPVDVGTLPLGGGVEDMEILVLDSEGQPLGTGEAGEIAVRSDYLALGYWRRPDLTTAAFRQDEPGGGKRTYRTGDLGRMRADGCLEYLGRSDSLPKIRGQRVEVDAVERALSSLDGVANVVVLAREDPGHEPRLVAYLVPEDGVRIEVHEVRRSLERRVPFASVPSAFVVLHQLPLADNGKVDFRALPPPGRDRPRLDTPYLAPRSEVEVKLTDLWADLLAIEKIGVDDRFFDLGGDSLLAARMVVRIRAILGVELPIRSVFDGPSVAELARSIESSRPAPADNAFSVPIARLRESCPQPLSAAQRRIWLLHQIAGPQPVYNEATAVRLRGPLDQDALQGAFTRLIDRHDALGLTIRCIDGVPEQCFGSGRNDPIEVKDLRAGEDRWRDGEARVLLEEHAKRAFDLERGPVIRALLLRLNDNEHVLSIVVHHVACDAWSFANVWRDLSEYYLARVSGGAVSIGRLPCTFRDYVDWERGWLARDEVAAQVDDWVESLAHRVRPPPKGRASAANDSVGAAAALRSGVASARFEAAMVDGIEALATRSAATPFMVILTGLAIALRHWTGQTDIVIGSPVGGRLHMAAENLVGCFVNTVVLSVDVSGDPTFDEMLRQVRETTLAAYARQDAPFDAVIGRLAQKGLAGAAQMLGVVVSMQNVPAKPGELFGLDTTEVEVSTGCAKTDLGFSIKPDGKALRVTAEFREDCHDARAVRVLLEEWLAVLTRGLRTPLTRVSQFSLASAALPDPWEPGDSAATSAGAGDTQEVLSSLWQRELRLPRVERHRTFAELGGHSLGATRLICRIQDAFGARLTHREFFQAGTIARLALLIDERRVAKTAVTLREQPAAADGTPLQLTAPQSSLWPAVQFHLGLPVYNEPFVVRLRESVEPDALEQALNIVIDRHAALRTAFVSSGSGPRQEVRSRARLRLEVVEVAAGEGSEAVLEELATASARRPFDLSRPPLMRALFARVGDSDTRLYLTIHHLVIDAFGLYFVLMPEMMEECRAIARGGGHSQSARRTPIAMRVCEEREVVENRTRATRRYWRAQLEGARPPELPTDFLRPALPSGRGAFVPFRVDGFAANRLEAIAREQGVTLHAVLLAAFFALVQRWTGERDLLVGTFDAGRNSTAQEAELGYHLRTLPMRVVVEGDPVFVEFASEVHRCTLDALEHAELPLPEIVGQSAEGGIGGPGALVRIAFVMEPSLPIEEAWTLSQHEIQTGTSKYDLTIEVERRIEGIIGRIEYSSDLFVRATIESFDDAWRTLLASVCEDPGRTLSRLRILSEAQRQRVLVEFNGTARSYPHEASIHDVFAHQVRQAPDAVAVICGDVVLGYRELDQRANRVAARLLDLGVAPAQRVALLGGRSIEFVIGALAILKTGAAYVPLEPSYPTARKRLMLEDCAANVVLVSDGSPDLAATEGRVVVGVREAELTSASAVLPERSPGADGVACVMYTSGSTGKPKGVLVTHRGIVRLVCNSGFLPDRAGRRFLLHSPTTFDASHFELWAPLLNGARCAILVDPAATLLDLERHLHQYRVDCLWLTSALFNAVLDHRPQMLGGLRELLIGGEALSVEHVRRARATHPDLRLFNGYGPTENTTFTCVYEIPANLPNAIRSIPIGRPIGNTRALLRDRHGELVPVGFPGEIVAAGDGVALGYLNPPGGSAECFFDEPLGLQPGARAYRTGDLGRWRPDGVLEFLGRIDRQLKIRGHRIEPAEIELRLRAHPAVRECLVETAGEGDDRLLVAYVVPRDPEKALPGRLREFLADQLPAYMVPSRWHTLARLPLAPSGKVAREMLPAPEQCRTALPADRGGALQSYSEESRAAAEDQVVGVFAGVLGRSAFGRDDDFFFCGGHSLTASVLAARLSGLFGVEVPLRKVFEARTPASMANWLADIGAVRRVGRSSAHSGASLIRLREGRSEFTLILAHSLAGDVYAFDALSSHLPEDASVYAFHPAEIDGSTPESIEAMAAPLTMQLADLDPRGRFCLAGYSFGGLIAFEAARQWVASGRPTPRVAIIDTGPAPPPRSVQSVSKDLLRAIGNLPWWLWYDIVKGTNEVIASDARRKLRVISRRVLAQRKGDTTGGVLQPDDIFDVEGLSENVLVDMQRRLRAASRYRPPPYPGAITLFKARARPLTRALEPDLGWGRVALGGVDVLRVPGNHRSMIQPPYVGMLARRLGELIAGGAADS